MSKNKNIFFVLISAICWCCCCHTSLALKLNLTESCAQTETYFCTLSNISATLDNPLIIVNSTAGALVQLLLRNSVISRIPRGVFVQAPNLKSFLMHNCGLNRLNVYDLQPAYKLQTLVLQQNRLFDLPEKVFASANNLEELHLGRNMIHMVHRAAFDELKKLRYLDLQQNDIRELPKQLFDDLIKLEHIDLSSNNIDTIESQTFAQNSALRTLLLSDNKFTVFEANALEHLPHLHLLDISSSSLDSLNVQSVDTLLLQSSGLRRLNIAGSAIKVHAGNNQLMNISIGDKLTVRELDLHGNLFETLEDLVGMMNLQRLDLSRNRLTTLRTWHSPHFLPLPNLVHLSLATNQLQNLSAENFLLLQKLTHLDLAFNQLLRLDTALLEPLVNLEKFYMEGNRLHSFDYENFQRSHEYIKELGMFENEWEFRYMRKMVVYFQEHGVQLPVRFASSSNAASVLHDTTVSTLPSAGTGKTTAHHRYASTASSDTDDLTAENDEEHIDGIHPYWTSRDIMVLATLIFVLLVLLLQLFNIMREEECLPFCCHRGVRSGTTERQRLDEEDSEV